MDEDIKGNDAIEIPADASRPTFIKGIICSGATAFSAGDLFRASLGVPELLPQAAISERLLTLHVNGQQRRVDVSRQETLAWTLRYGSVSELSARVVAKYLATWASLSSGPTTST